MPSTDDSALLAQLHHFFNALHTAVVVADPQGKRVYHNSAAASHTLPETLSTEQPPNGWAATSWLWEHRHFVLWQQVATEENASQPEQWLLNNLFDSNTDSTKLIDLQGKVLRMNQLAREAMPLQAVGKWSTLPWPQWWDGSSQAVAAQALADLAEGRSTRFSATKQLQDGRWSHWDVTLIPLKNANGRYERGLVLSRDISVAMAKEAALEKSLQALEKQSAEFRFVTDFMPQMVWATEPDGYHDFYNQRWYEYTGLSYEETKADGWNRVLHPEDQQRALEVWGQSLATGAPYEIEYRFCRHNGQYRWFLGRAMPMRNEAGEIVKWFGTCTDIQEAKSEQQQLEQLVAERTAEIAEALERVQLNNNFIDGVLEASPSNISVVDQTLRIKLVNKQWERTYGIARADAVGQHYNLFLPAEANPQLHLDIAAGLSGKTIHYSNIRSQLTGRYLEMSIVPLWQKGQVDGLLIISYDISALVEASNRLKATNAELKQINEDLTQFAYIASHDLQEPLRKVQVFGDLAMQRFGKNEPELERYLATMINGAARMSQLIKDLLKYSKISGADRHFEAVDLNKLLAQVCDDYDLLLKENGTLVQAHPLPVVQGIPVQLHQLFSNLLSNALKFSEGQILQIEIVASKVSRDQLPEELAEKLVGASHYHQIEFCDNGPGVAPEYAEKIFSMFQRLQADRVAGTGMGLAICRKIAENHQGWILLNPSENGAHFVIYLPLQ